MRDDVTVVIPARYASTRLPGKPLVDLCGKPMIVRSWERVCLDVPAERVIIATDDQRIVKACWDHGIERVEMTSETCRTGTDRVAEVCNRCEDRSGVWVVAMGDNPLLSRGVIGPIVDGLVEGPYATIGRTRVDEHEVQDETAQKMVITSTGYEMYASRRPIPYAPNDSGIYWKQVNVYAMWPDTLRLFGELPTGENEARETLEILRLIEHGYPVKSVEVHDEGFSVDVPADVKKACRALGCKPATATAGRGETLPDYLL